MHPLYNSFTALAVASIYTVWRSYQLTRVRRAQTLHERVAYMLWVVASRIA